MCGCSCQLDTEHEEIGRRSSLIQSEQSVPLDDVRVWEQRAMKGIELLGFQLLAMSV